MPTAIKIGLPLEHENSISGAVEPAERPSEFPPRGARPVEYVRPEPHDIFYYLVASIPGLAAVVRKIDVRLLRRGEKKKP